MVGAGAWLGLAGALAGPLVALGLLGTPARGSVDVRALQQGAGPAPASGAPSAPSAQPAQPVVVPVVQRGDGRPVVVAGESVRRGTGPLRRFTVEVEGGLGVDPVGFARAVEATLSDARSWGAAGRSSFQRVASGPVAFRVVLASPDTTDRLCRPLRTGGTYSCANGERAVINSRRWLRGATSYARDPAGYRQYVVNHEVGHTLDHRHERCPGAGRPAPVMVQQTKGLGGCAKNAWPYPA